MASISNCYNKRLDSPFLATTELDGCYDKRANLGVSNNHRLKFNDTLGSMAVTFFTESGQKRINGLPGEVLTDREFLHGTGLKGIAAADQINLAMVFGDVQGQLSMRAALERGDG